jgi:hypothetical protein
MTRSVSVKHNTVVLVADGSETAKTCWKKTSQVITNLIKCLPEDTIWGVYLLGTNRCWKPKKWHADMAMPPMANGSGSFLAPIMIDLYQRRVNPERIIVVGAGKLFDIEDWGEAVDWILVQTGDASLQAENTPMLEITSEEINHLPEIMPSRVDLDECFATQSQKGRVEQQWRLDPIGYPMIKIPPLDAYVHLFPITKSQFEQFLADKRSLGYGDAKYAQLLALNPRLSPFADSFANYERLFVTGIIPKDIKAYIQWSGSGFRLPDYQEWVTTFRWLKQQDLSVLPAELEHLLDPRASSLWNGLLKELRPETLLDLSLMKFGLIEWIQTTDQQYAGMGLPRQSFRRGYHEITNPYQPTLTMLEQRSKYFGFRLMI